MALLPKNFIRVIFFVMLSLLTFRLSYAEDVQKPAGEPGEFDIFDVKSTDLPDTTVGKEYKDEDIPVPDFIEFYDEDLEKGEPTAKKTAPVAPPAPPSPAATTAPATTKAPEPKSVENPAPKQEETPATIVETPAIEAPALPEVPATPADAPPPSAPPAVGEETKSNEMLIDAFIGASSKDQPSVPAAPEENTEAVPPPTTETTAETAEIPKTQPENSPEIESEYQALRGYLNNFINSFNGTPVTEVSGQNPEEPQQQAAEEQPVPAAEAQPEQPAAVAQEEKPADAPKEISVDEFEDFLDMDSAKAPATPEQPKEAAAPVTPVADAPAVEKPVAEAPKAISPKEAMIAKIKQSNPAISEAEIIQLAGDCFEFSDKLKNCEAFECSMPSEEEEGKIIHKKIEGQIEGKCRYVISDLDNKDLPILTCNLSNPSRDSLADKNSAYLSSAGKTGFSIKNDFSAECSATVAVAAQPEQPKEAEKPAATTFIPVPVRSPESMISPADKEYFALLDEKQKALPKNKMLSDSTLDTMKRIAPTIVKSDTPTVKPAQKNVSVKHGENDNISANYPDLNLSVTNSSDENSNINVAEKMDEAYRALLSGQISASITIYKSILSQHPDNKNAQFGLATAYHRNSQFEQAREIYTEILKANPNDKEALNNFLVLVAEEAPESALIELQKLERINSDFSPIPAQIAMINLKLNNPKKAERYLRRAVILSPDNITYKYNLAITSDRLGKYDQAIRLYRQIVEAVEHGGIIPGSLEQIKTRLSFLESRVE